MRTLFIWLALVVVGIGAALYFGRSRVETGAANRPWPLGLGNVADAPKHFPVTKDNAQATKLIALASKTNVDLGAARGRRGGVPEDLREELGKYASVQLERSGDAIDAPPSDVARYLTVHAATLDEIRALALSGTPIVFAADPAQDLLKERSGPNLFALQYLQRTFVVRALDAARAGNAAAWDELRAAWELTRPLWRRPDPEAVLAGMTAARMVNAAARKMPLPPPAWFREVSTFDYERAYVAAQLAQAWRNKQPALNERLRGMAEEVLRAKACDVASPQFDAVREKLGGRATPSLVSGWERLLRFRAEREATERVLQIRAGQAPSRDSQCSDGSWEVTPKSFRFTRDIESEYPAYDYPLEYSAGQAEARPTSAPAPAR
jgi:hypothetical protein